MLVIICWPALLSTSLTVIFTFPHTINSVGLLVQLQGTRSTCVKVESLFLTQSFSRASHRPSLPTYWAITHLISSDILGQQALGLVRNDFPPSFLHLRLVSSPCPPWCLETLVGCWTVPGAPRWCLPSRYSGPLLYLIPFRWMSQCSADHGLTSPQHHTAPI